MSERSTAAAAADGTLKKESNQTNDEGRKEGRKGRTAKGTSFARSLAAHSGWVTLRPAREGERGGVRGGKMAMAGRQEWEGRQQERNKERRSVHEKADGGEQRSEVRGDRRLLAR